MMKVGLWLSSWGGKLVLDIGKLWPDLDRSLEQSISNILFF